MTTETPIDDASNATLTDPAPIDGDHPGGPRHDQPPFPAVAAGVDAYLATDSSGHDMHHVWRVFRLTQRFADELNADHDVVGCAALTHDIHRILGDGTGCDPEEKFTSLHKAWNARMESNLYHRRNMNETVNAVIKQKFGTFVVTRPVEAVPRTRYQVRRLQLGTKPRYFT